MDKRGWPWKKKSTSDKQASEKAAIGASDLAASVNHVDKATKDDKKTKYVQISMESYTHLTGLEDQVKTYEEQVQTIEDEIKELSEKLSEANSEISNKEELVKQHTKVAEEAVSGWEKAEAEAAALKNHLESVTLLKLTAEDRASHLDGALKECMRQIRNLKEEHEQKLQEIVLNKGKLFDKMKLELESKMFNLDQELHRAAGENAVLSRSLQDHSSMLVQLSEEKSQAEAEIELLKSNIESCEKDVNSLKYELHIARKEVEIRNEERNMSVRSAEVANKHHLEGVKKIAKLEAECQRLRGLVRKKLPGPAALAQMKLEVENLGRDCGESRFRRSPVKPPSPPFSQAPEFSFDNSPKYIKDNDLLTERVLAMEEDTKMLKEALARRNSELQTSRSMYAQLASKLQRLEAEFQANGEELSLLKSTTLVPTEGFCSQRASHQPSFTSPSEDGLDDNVSSAGSWSTGLMSELSRFKKEKNVESSHRSESTNNLDLMDDFLEMEKLAYLTNESNVTASISNADLKTEAFVEVTGVADLKFCEEHDSESLGTPKENVTETNSQLQEDSFILAKLKSRISMVLELISNEKDKEDVSENIKYIMQDMHDSLLRQPVRFATDVDHYSDKIRDLNILSESAKIASTKVVDLPGDDNARMSKAATINREVQYAIDRIYEFIRILGREAKVVPDATPDGNGLNAKIDMLSAKYADATNNDNELVDFVLNISHVFSELSKLHFNVLGFKSSELESSSSDCIDKIALPENKAAVDSVGERYPIGCAHFSDSSSDPDVPNDGRLVPTSESSGPSWKCSLEEFEQLKVDKDNLAVDLARCMEHLENTKLQLLEREQLLAEVKSQLSSAQKSNSLAETQLKCMAESYKSLETREEELQTEVLRLHGRIESLENEIQEERRSHQEALDRYKDLQEQLERIDCPKGADMDDKSCQEQELAAAAEKLAECQETIFLLGKQLKALRPQTETITSLSNRRTQKVEAYAEEPTTIGKLQDIDPSEMDTVTSLQMHRVGSESPMEVFNNSFLSPSDAEVNNLLRSPVSSKYPKHRPTNSDSSDSSTLTPEKNGRGFSRFFSSKGKNGQ